MAVYTVENGQLKRVAESLTEYSSFAWDDGLDGDAYFKEMGFHLWDGVEGAYRLYQRVDGEREILPGVLHIFDVMAHDSVFDTVLVGDNLPDFLTVMKAIEPLSQRSYALAAEMAAESKRKRKG